MRVNVFAAIIEQHPEIEKCLETEIGPACMTGGKDHPDMTRAEWIERYVNNVVVLKPDQLSLFAKNEGSEAADTTVRYSIFHHYQGTDSMDETPSCRIKYQGEDGTLRYTLGVLRGQNRAFRPDQLVIDVIVRHTRVRTEGVRYYRETLEVYPFSLHESCQLLAGIPVPPLGGASHVKAWGTTFNHPG